MTVTDQIKILNRKIKQNESQYELERKAAKISTLSSNNLDKYEYLTGEDLGLKPSTVEQAKFEYSPLGKIFNKGLDEEDKKEGLFKRLENIKEKNEELLNAFNTTNKVISPSKNKTNKKFAKFKDIDEFKTFSLDSMETKLKNFNEKFIDLKNLNPRTEDNKELKKMY